MACTCPVCPPSMSSPLQKRADAGPITTRTCFAKATNKFLNIIEWTTTEAEWLLQTSTVLGEKWQWHLHICCHGVLTNKASTFMPSSFPYYFAAQHVLLPFKHTQAIHQTCHTCCTREKHYLINSGCKLENTCFLKHVNSDKESPEALKLIGCAHWPLWSITATCKNKQVVACTDPCGQWMHCHTFMYWPLLWSDTADKWLHVLTPAVRHCRATTVCSDPYGQTQWNVRAWCALWSDSYSQPQRCKRKWSTPTPWQCALLTCRNRQPNSPLA